jgi:hypothetical protein
VATRAAGVVSPPALHTAPASPVVSARRDRRHNTHGGARPPSEMPTSPTQHGKAEGMAALAPRDDPVLAGVDAAEAQAAVATNAAAEVKALASAPEGAVPLTLESATRETNTAARALARAHTMLRE